MSHDPIPPVADDGLLIRRPTMARFRSRPRVPEAAAEADPLLLAPSTVSGHKTERRREIAGDLPAWDPLPPGEIAVTRKR